MVDGGWCIVYGGWCIVYGAWCMVHGVWCMVHGAWCSSLLACLNDDSLMSRVVPFGLRTV
jgi:hypothetical protein